MNSQQTVPIAADAIFANISDADFRTYTIICQQAWHTSPEAERPYIELSHAQIADLHPNAKKPATNTIRVRIQRLVAQGLLTRERVSNTRWRTRPTIAMGAPILPISVIENEAEMEQIGAHSAIAHRENLNLGDRSVISQTSLGDLPTITQSDAAQVGDRQVITQAGDNSMGDLPVITQTGDNSVTDPPAITQNLESVGWVIAQRAATAQNGDLGDRSTRGQPLDTDLTDLDLDLDLKKQQKTDQIKQTDQPLAAQLAALRPEAMSAEGIAECLTQPKLTAAWLVYVTDPANGVRKPAAYLRRQVRCGCFPEPKFTPNLLWNHHGEPNANARHSQHKSDPHASMAVAAPQATRWPLDVS